MNKSKEFCTLEITERKYKRFTIICCSIEWKMDVMLFSFYIYTVLPFRTFVKIPPFTTPYGLVVTSRTLLMSINV